MCPVYGSWDEFVTRGKLFLLGDVLWRYKHSRILVFPLNPNFKKSMFNY